MGLAAQRHFQVKPHQLVEDFEENYGSFLEGFAAPVILRDAELGVSFGEDMIDMLVGLPR